MFVIDALRPLRDGRVVLPPYHGHLGFIAPLELHVRLVHPTHDSPGNTRRCEVLCTAYEPRPTGELVDLKCVMSERKGVVASLCSAVSQTGANIIAQESSVIDHLDHHVVHMTLDCSSMGARRPLRHDDARLHRFREFQHSCPSSDLRHLTLLAHVIAVCGKDLHWFSNPVIPNIHLWPLNDDTSDLYRAGTGTASVLRRQGTMAGRHGYSEIELPKDIVARIRTKLDCHDGRVLKCLLLSQTVDRTLRIVFPHPEMYDRLIHIGFAHHDEPGTLAIIASAVASAGFNILTSLLRKTNTENQNVWEVWLDNQQSIEFGEAVDLRADSPETPDMLTKRLAWVKDRICSIQSSHYQNLMADRMVKLVAPAYPRSPVPGCNDVCVAFGPSRRTMPKKGTATRNTGPLEHVREQICNVDQPFSSEQAVDRLKTLRMVESFLAPDEGPTIFLSLPRTFESSGHRFARELESKGYVVDMYIVADGTPIVQSVVDRIKRCDFFAGMWQCASRGPGKNQLEHYTSPWLPFELGVARAVNKPWAYVASSLLDEDVMRSLADNKSIPSFDLGSPAALKKAFDTLAARIADVFPARRVSSRGGAKIARQGGSEKVVKKSGKKSRKRRSE